VRCETISTARPVFHTRAHTGGEPALAGVCSLPDVATYGIGDGDVAMHLDADVVVGTERVVFGGRIAVVVLASTWLAGRHDPDVTWTMEKSSARFLDEAESPLPGRLRCRLEGYTSRFRDLLTWGPGQRAPASAPLAAKSVGPAVGRLWPARPPWTTSRRGSDRCRRGVDGPWTVRWER